jgi:PhnB protein
MQVQPYLFFDGRCEEAINFYREALEAKVDALLRYKEAPPAPGQPMPPADKVMHAALHIGDTQLLLSDGHCAGNPSFKGFSLTVSARDDAEAKRFFGALSEGGQVTQPLTKTFFASSFGMCTDRFGLGWMVIAGGGRG